MKLFVSTDPFSSTSPEPLNKLKYNGFDFRLNRFGRKITTSELAEEIQDAEVLIAGTEIISESVLQSAKNLKLISRVGIGLDGVDFDLCGRYGVQVAYTPDAPTIAVAELTVGLILDLSRKISETNDALKQKGKWHRHMGMLLNGKTIGLFGMGRIGKSVIHLLSAFNVNFLVCDKNPDVAFSRLHKVQLATKSEVLKYSDVVSVHIPLNQKTRNFIAMQELRLMKANAVLINTARGGIVNESDLYTALKDNLLAGAAIDVFESEPYTGPLREFNNTLLTCHMGASTVDSRTAMEIEAVEEAIRFKNNTHLKNPVFRHG